MRSEPKNGRCSAQPTLPGVGRGGEYDDSMISIADRLAELLADPTFEPELLAESQRIGTEIPWWFGQLRTDVAYARPQKMSVSAL